MDDGRYAVVTADERDGHEGQYRLGFSETAEFDGDRMKIMEGVSLESLKKDLTGIADGSIVVGENRLEYAKTQENAPASGEGVVNGQVMAESANEAQKAEFGDVSEVENSERKALENENTSIKNQMRERLDEINAMESVAKVKYEKLPNKEKLRQKLVEEFSKYGEQIDRNGFGVIQVGKEEISSGLNYVYTDAEYAAFFAVPKILKRGIVISGHADHKGRSYGTITIAAPIEINGERAVVGVVVKQAGKNRYKTHRVLLPDGKELYLENKKDTGSTVVRHALPKGDQRSTINPVSNTSIPQKSEMSTDSGEKIVEAEGSQRSSLPKTREARARKLKRAQAHQQQAKEKRKAARSAAEQVAEQRRGEQETAGASPTEGTTERAMPRRGYTDAEANEARGLVSDFDLLTPSVRRSIIELVRSGKKSGASKNFLRHSANLIAYWRRGLWVIADDKTRDDGFYTVFSDGSRLIVVKPNREAKAVSETLMHELGHDVWARADEKTRKVLYELATEGVKQEEIDAIRERYREELTKRGEIPEKADERSKAATTESESNGRSPHPPLRRSPFPAGEGLEMTEAEVEALLDEEVATNLMGEIIGKEEFLKRFDGSETSALKRILRTLSNMKKRFTGKDKYLYRKADDLFKAFTKVMALEEVQGAMTERSRHDLSGNNAKYDFTKPFYEQVKDWKAGVFPQRDSLMLGATPEVFQKIGFNALPMTINQEHVDYALNGAKNAEHHIGEILLNYLPTALKNPVAIITSETQNSTSVVAILSITHNGEQIIAPVYIDGVGKQNGIRIDSNAVTSVHGRKNALTKLLQNAIADEASGKVGIFYWDKRRAIALLSGGKVTMPNVPNTLSDGFIHSIRENGSPVKSKLKNVTESQQFKRWFGDWQNHPDKASKVVNDDGSPRVLYHQTEADIEEFDTRHKGSGTNDDETPFGIFMKPTDQDIGLKGKKQMALYARIVNPLVVANRYELVRQIKTMSPAYAELLKQRDALSVEYKQKIEDAAKKWSQYAKDYRDTHPDATRSAIYEDEEFRRLYDAEDEFTEEWVRKADELALKCKEEITQTLKKNGYDGVHLKRDEGSGGRSVETFIALDATQVKSATDNNGTFDGQDPHIRHALPKKDADEVIERTYANGMGQKSQTTAKAEADATNKASEAKPKKPKRTAAQIARENAEKQIAVEKARAEEKAARAMRNAQKSAENAAKNAEKKIAAEKDRLEREGSETLKKNSRQIARIDKNLDYLKNAVLHRRNTDGGNASSIIFEDPALRAVVKRLASRGTAYGLMHKSTREGMQDLLTWYTPENEILSGNAIDELLSASPQSVSNVFGGYNADIRDKKKPVNKRRAFLNQVCSVIYSSTSALA